MKNNEKTFEKQYELLKKTSVAGIGKMPETEWGNFKSRYGITVDRSKFVATIKLFQRLSLEEYIDVIINDPTKC